MGCPGPCPDPATIPAPTATPAGGLLSKKRRLTITSRRYGTALCRQRCTGSGAPSSRHWRVGRSSPYTSGTKPERKGGWASGACGRTMGVRGVAGGVAGACKCVRMNEPFISMILYV